MSLPEGIYQNQKIVIWEVIPKIAIFERRYILKTIVFGIYVRFRGGRLTFLNHLITEPLRSFSGGTRGFGAMRGAGLRVGWLVGWGFW